MKRFIYLLASALCTIILSYDSENFTKIGFFTLMGVIFIIFNLFDKKE